MTLRPLKVRYYIYRRFVILAAQFSVMLSFFVRILAILTSSTSAHQLTPDEIAAQKRRAYSEEAWRRYQEYQKVGWLTSPLGRSVHVAKAYRAGEGCGNAPLLLP